MKGRKCKNPNCDRVVDDSYPYCALCVYHYLDITLEEKERKPEVTP